MIDIIQIDITYRDENGKTCHWKSDSKKSAEEGEPYGGSLNIDLTSALTSEDSDD